MYFSLNGFKRSWRVGLLLALVGLGFSGLVFGNNIAQAESTCDPAADECSSYDRGVVKFCSSGNVKKHRGTGACTQAVNNDPDSYACRTSWKSSTLEDTCSCGCEAINGGARCISSCPTAVCGNGTKEGNEECDDGDTTSGDGCSSTCKNETTNSCLAGSDQCTNDFDCGGNSNTSYTIACSSIA